MTEEPEILTIDKNELNLIYHSEDSDWECRLFGMNTHGLVWRPVKGEVPNWFWRWMQYLILGNKWAKDK